MIRVIADGRSAEGLPFVHWEQVVPTGQSVHALEQSVILKIAAVVMTFVFVAVWAGSGQIGLAAISALIIAGMCFAGDKMFKGGVKVWDIHIPGPEPREGEA